MSAQQDAAQFDKPKDLLRMGARAAAGARQAGAVAVASGRWLTDTVVGLAPQIPVRDVETLLARHQGLAGDQLADALIDSAAKLTGGIGAAAGVFAAAEWNLPPALLSLPVQLAAETIAVVAVELKLVAELHEVYAKAPAGSPSARATAYLSAWARRRGIDPATTAGVGDIVSAAAKKQLRNRLVRRTGSSTVSALPFLAGAVAGATVNARSTKRLGELVAADLVKKSRRR
jgi:hypothetical protein